MILDPLSRNSFLTSEKRTTSQMRRECLVPKCLSFRGYMINVCCYDFHHFTETTKYGKLLDVVVMVTTLEDRNMTTLREKEREGYQKKEKEREGGIKGFLITSHHPQQSLWDYTDS